MGFATTAARKVVSSSTLIGPFEFERECKGPLNLSARSNFKWTNFSFFSSLSTAKAHGFGVEFIELYGTVCFIAIRDFSL